MIKLNNGDYLGILGKSSDLAWGELHAVFPETTRLTTQLVKFDHPIESTSILRRLGGLVKILQVIDKSFLPVDGSKIAFSSLNCKDNLWNYASEVKKQAKQQGISFHFRILDSIYSSAGISNSWIEYSQISYEGNVIFTKTVVAQDIDHWSLKDYGRPGVNTRSGMMPPKIARIMVNLALPHGRGVFFDPFCGSGTLLVEALDLGHQVVGSDLSPVAITDSLSNCRWFNEKLQLNTSFNIFTADAAHVNVNQTGNIDGIAFEGYLGPPNPQPEKFKDLIKGMGKLYKGVLKNLYHILKLEGYLVCALPEYNNDRKTWNLDTLIDATSELGYTQIATYSYARPQAVVGRKIYVLKKVAR